MLKTTTLKFSTLRGYYTLNQKLACFVRYLNSSINIFLKNDASYRLIVNYPGNSNMTLKFK